MNDQDPEVLQLLEQLNQWWDTNLHFVVQMETKGQFMDSLTTMYYFVDSFNRRLYRGETWVRVPFEAHYLFQNLEGVSYCLFPETNEHVADGSVILYEGFLEGGLGPLSQASVMLQGTKERSLQQANGQSELLLKLDPPKLGIAPANADMFLTVRTDSSPRITSFEQVRLGVRQTTTLNYVTTNRDQVLASLPQLPPPNTVNQSATFDEALKRNILHFRNLKATEV